MIYRQLTAELQKWKEMEKRKPLVTSPTGHHFRLVNIPFYYVGMLDEILKRL